MQSEQNSTNNTTFNVAKAQEVTLPRLLSESPMLNQENEILFRRQLRDYFTSTFNRYESLFECLTSDEAYWVKPIALRHPLIFYYGHTATFFVNKLLLSRMITTRINQQFESVFAVGVDEMSWDDLNDEHYAWPQPAEVKQYRDQVRTLVLSLIDQAPLSLPVDWNNPWWAIVMGIEHERIHLETSSVLIRQHQLKYVKNSPQWQPCYQHSVAPTNKLLNVPAGTVRLAKNKQAPDYGWDNEYGIHEAHISEFKASRFLVSNHEFLAFVEAGGYLEHHNWEEEGRGWLDFTGAQHPTFWVKKNRDWYLRLMTEEVPMPWDWPVEVNFHEAKAFCNWLQAETGQSFRLPSEDEWYRLYDESVLASPNKKPADANIQLNHFASPCAVNRFRHGDFYDVVGNVWQWTETPIYPFDGFEVHPTYDDFTTPTFDARHNLMKGGSWISSGNASQPSSRYAFRRHFFQHAGFRYVISEELHPMPVSHYETDKLLSEYAEFHYGEEYFGVPNFPKALVELALQYTKSKPMHRALDIGCATGRASFELSRSFDKVTAIDFSTRFINLGVQLARGEALRYTLAEEGELVSYRSRSLQELGLIDFAHKVEFFQGDACNLKEQFSGYDFILAANLIDRLYSPEKFLQEIHLRLNVGGLLMITSPYTWLAEHTPREAWLGGFKKDGESFTTLDGSHHYLNKHFRRIAEPQEVPFVIRETRRKFQHSLSEVTIWERIA